MTIAFLALALCASPIWQGVESSPVSPATVLSTTVLFATDFGPQRGLDGFLLSPRGAELASEGDEAWLRLVPAPERATDVWLSVPSAAGRFIHLTGRVRAEGDAALVVAAVEGTRSPMSTVEWARREVPAGAEWQPFRLAIRVPGAADSLVFRAGPGGGPVELDDLELSVETRVRDQRVEALRSRTGNLIFNGGFEMGTAGFEVVARHPTLADGDPPAPGALRAMDQDRAQGSAAAATFVAEGALTLTPRTVVLKPDTEYTLGLMAKAHGRTPARMRLELIDGEGRSFGRKEYALSDAWSRYSTRIKTPPTGPLTWLPQIIFYAGAQPYAVQLDALVLRVGDESGYLQWNGPELVLEVKVGDELRPATIVAPDERVLLVARTRSVDGELAVTVRGTLESHLGLVRTALGGTELATGAGSSAETTVFEGTLEPGWYRFTVELVRGEEVLARAERVLVSAPAPATGDGWRFVTTWTTPDALLSGRARAAWLAQAVRLGITDRLLARNASAYWRGQEPRPGQARVESLRAMVEAGAAAGLGTVIELDPYPTAKAAPEWLLELVQPREDGRVVPPLETWNRRLRALANGLRGLSPDWWLTPPPAAVPEDDASRRAAADEVLGAAQEGWRVLPAVAALPEIVCGPSASDAVEPLEGPDEPDPFVAARRRIVGLCEAAASGQRTIVWPNQGLVPVGEGRYAHGGWTDADGELRPDVAAWLTLRRLIGSAELATTAANDATGVRLAVFGAEPAVALLWSTAGQRRLGWAPEPGVGLYLITGERLTAAEDGLVADPWPVLLTGLSGGDVVGLTAAVSGSS